MVAEWLIALLVLAGVAAALFARVPNRWSRMFAVAFLAGGVGALAFWQRNLETKAVARAHLSVPRPEVSQKYASSDSCRACHPNQYGSWHDSFHRTMTQVASPESIRGDFNNVTLALDGNTYHLERNGDEFWVEMPDPDWTLRNAEAGQSKLSKAPSVPLVRKRISMVTGSHRMQAYWTDNQHGNEQFSFPFTYLFEQERWVPRRTVFMMNPHMTNWAQVWNLGCIGCHSTAGQPMQKPGNTGFDTRIAELGISCEACHGPAAEHVRLNSDPRRRYGLHLKKQGDDQIINPSRLSHRRASEICGSCHSVHVPLDANKWLSEGEIFHPGDELETKTRLLTNPRNKEQREGWFWRDGMIRVSGREYTGLLKTACFQKGEMSCLSCHSVHDSSPNFQVSRGMESNAACLQCHQSFAAKLEEHTHHPANSAGSLCYNCHMPYTSYGLLKGIRAHQISSPTIKASLQTGRPDACNLCHLDKTLDWAGQKLTAWYKQPREELSVKEKSVAASVLWATQGDAGQRGLIAWHMGWEPARQISGENWLPPYLATLMQDDYPAVRCIAGRSLKSLRGFERVPYDYVAEDKLRDAAKLVFAQWQKLTKPKENPSLLLGKNGDLQDEQLRELLAGQNHRVVNLNE